MLLKEKYIREKKKTFIIAINKPKGVICTHRDENGRVRIYDLIPKPILKNFNGEVHSIGRLDYNSQGLILVTNDTKIKSYLENPSSKILRVYKVKIQGLIDIANLKRLKKGLYIGSQYYSIVSLELIKKTKSYSWILIKLDQGKNQHIRKIFKKVGFSVNKLIRIQYGPYKIGSLQTGKTKILNFNKLRLNHL